jgi:hypothetical protein
MGLNGRGANAPAETEFADEAGGRRGQGLAEARRLGEHGEAQARDNRGSVAAAGRGNPPALPVPIATFTI